MSMLVSQVNESAGDDGEGIVQLIDECVVVDGPASFGQ